MGYWGDGVYFFPANENGQDLAKRYYNSAHCKGQYNDSDDHTCVVLTASIVIKEDNFVDLRSPEFREGIANLDTMLTGRDKYNAIEKNRIRNEYILRYQKIIGNEIYCFASSIPLNKKFFESTQGSCFVVREICCIEEPPYHQEGF